MCKTSGYMCASYMTTHRDAIYVASTQRQCVLACLQYDPDTGKLSKWLKSGRDCDEKEFAGSQKS